MTAFAHGPNNFLQDGLEASGPIIIDFQGPCLELQQLRSMWSTLLHASKRIEIPKNMEKMRVRRHVCVGQRHDMNENHEGVDIGSC